VAPPDRDLLLLAPEGSPQVLPVDVPAFLRSLLPRPADPDPGRLAPPGGRLSRTQIFSLLGEPIRTSNRSLGVNDSSKLE
jgi:hypothetical protein